MVQAVNGGFLVASFFGARLVYGNLNSVWVFYDVFSAIIYGQTEFTKTETGAATNYTAQDLLSIAADEQGQRLAFAGGLKVPLWIGLIYLASNLTLNSLNIFWFGKMIETIRKRFDPPFGTKGIGADKVHYEPQEKVADAAGALVNNDAESAGYDPSKPKGSVKAARERAEAAVCGPTVDEEDIAIQRATPADGSKSVEVAGSRTLRMRRKA